MASNLYKKELGMDNEKENTSVQLPDGCIENDQCSVRLRAQLKELNGRYIDPKTGQVYRVIEWKEEIAMCACIAKLGEPIALFLPAWAIEPGVYIEQGDEPGYSGSPLWGFRSEVVEYLKKIFAESDI